MATDDTTKDTALPENYEGVVNLITRRDYPTLSNRFQQTSWRWNRSTPSPPNARRIPRASSGSPSSSAIRASSSCRRCSRRTVGHGNLGFLRDLVVRDIATLHRLLERVSEE